MNLGETGADPQPSVSFSFCLFLLTSVFLFQGFPDTSPLSFLASKSGRQSVFPVVIQTVGGRVSADRPQNINTPRSPPLILLPQVFFS
jgi:hypothetical protein